MYVSSMVIAVFVAIFAALAYSVWNTLRLKDAERKRLRREEDDKRRRAQVAEGVWQLFWGISEALELETAYEERDEYLDDGDDDEESDTKIWMKTEDVLEAANANMFNANVLLNCIEEFPNEAADLFDLTGATWADVAPLFSEYVQRLGVIAETHEAEAAKRIESFLDDPLLAGRPASQAYVEEVAEEIWSGFEEHAHKVQQWAIAHAVDRRRPTSDSIPRRFPAPSQAD